MKMNKKKWGKRRHLFIRFILVILVCPFIKFIYQYKHDKLKIKKKDKFIVLANHFTTLDPVFVGVTFNKPLYYVANDDMLNRGILSKLLLFCFGIIGKSKGKSDISTVKTMLQVLKEDNSICIFPEGNRTFSGELCYINKTITKFIKKANTPVIIYNLNGGYGVEPRWALKKRKGKFEGKIKKIISQEEINSLTLDELHQVLIDNLTTNSAPSTNEYISKVRAEKIERVLYICPECNKKQTISSLGNKFTCSSCHASWEYTPNLTITKDNKLYKYPTVSSWYNYQLDDIRHINYHIDQILFKDQGLLLYESCNHSVKKVIKKGEVILFNDKLQFEDITFKLESLEGVAVSSKQHIMFRFNNSTYTIENNKKVRNDFNALKYVQTINYIKSVYLENKEEFFGI